ncbi:MAG: DUF445 family protein [Gemmatimonadetes bacterium]|nr:DUF445 family protein [Gemmatimonadota bacterium]
MDPSSPWIAALVTVGVGAISGGLTNAIAVWMLFHPHEEQAVGPFRFHGAIPKNKARLAKAIGKVVGERLLTPTDLVEKLRAPEVRSAFAEALDRILDSVLEAEHGPLGERLDPEARAAVDRAMGDLGTRLAGSLSEYVASEEFRGVAHRWADRLEGEDGASVDRWLGEVAASPEVSEGIHRIVTGQLARMAEDTAPLGERIPAGLVPVVEQGISDAIPGAVEQLGTLVSDGSLRETIATALRETFDRSVRQMMIHERLLAKIVVNDKMMDRLLTAFERTGVDKLVEAVRSAQVKERVKVAINRGIHGVLERPLAERMAALGQERITEIESTVSGWLLDALRSDTLRRSILDGARGALRERVPDLLGRALASDAGRSAVQRAVASSGRALLDRPVGRPASWLGPDATAQLRRSAHERAWAWVEEQVPQVVARLQIQEMVEEKVLGFSTEKMEEIVRRVTQKELDLIVKLGYVLGAMVGLLAFGVNQLLG